MPDPILLVDILSPSNKAETWSNFWAYGTLPSLLDVLIVHSTKVKVHLLSHRIGAGPTTPSRSAGPGP